jgi:hypothetical protein
MTVSREQRAIANGTLALGRKLGVGGGRWVVTPPAGVSLSYTSWVGYVTDDSNPRVSSPAPGGGVSNQQWAATSPLSSPVLPAGATLTSASDASLRFTVVGPDIVAGYRSYRLEALP